MYEPLSGLGDDSVLSVGSPVKFTLATNKTLDFTSSADVIGSVTGEVSQYGEVTAASNPDFSGQYNFTIVPDVAMSQNDWVNILVQAMVDAGYPNASFVSILGGVNVPAEMEVASESDTATTAPDIPDNTAVQQQTATLVKPTKIPTVASSSSASPSTSGASLSSSSSPYIIAGLVAVGAIIGVIYFKKNKKR